MIRDRGDEAVDAWSVILITCYVLSRACVKGDPGSAISFRGYVAFTCVAENDWNSVPAFPTVIGSPPLFACLILLHSSVLRPA